MKQLIILLSLMTLGGLPAYSQVTVTYDAVVTTAFGPRAASIPAGQRLVISYAINTSAADADPNPGMASYDNAVLSMNISFPGINWYVNSGPQTEPYQGGVFVTNDQISSSGDSISDVVYLHGGNVTSTATLDGHTVEHLLLEFGDFNPAPALPTLVTSDALPLSNLATPFAYLHLATDDGLTTVRITATPPVTVSFDAEVIFANGHHASAFPDGQPVRVSYTVARTATDTDPDPSVGMYDNVVFSAHADFGGLGIFANAGPPQRPASAWADVGNNVLYSTGAIIDQVELNGGPISSASLLAGETITGMRLEFLDIPLDEDLAPVMLANDELPLTLPRATHIHVLLKSGTASFTFVHLALPPHQRIQYLIDDVTALVASGGIPADRANRLLNALRSAYSGAAKRNDSAACNHLRSFIDRVEDEIEDGTLASEPGRRMIRLALWIQLRLGC